MRIGWTDKTDATTGDRVRWHTGEVGTLVSEELTSTKRALVKLDNGDVRKVRPGHLSLVATPKKCLLETLSTEEVHRVFAVAYLYGATLS